MDIYSEALGLHNRLKGKLEIRPRKKLSGKKDLSLLYTPGVAQPCREIHKDKGKVYSLTMKHNTVAVVTDGSAVLGLGNIGAEASLPVMEGKCLLFKELAGIDAFPIALAMQDTEKIIETVKNISPIFGGINLEDIASPKCFEVEERLQGLGIPVMHDDQHGTAVVVRAALKNACKVSGKEFGELKIVISGAGAAGTAIAKMIACEGIDKGTCIPPREILQSDINGIIYKDRKANLPHHEKLLEIVNPKNKKGALAEAVAGADVFIGVSAPNILTGEMVKSMAEKPIIFAMANPVPEIDPLLAKKAGAFIIATGRSDFPNQINNCLAFPGIFRGALDARAERITSEMKIAASDALAGLVKPSRKRLLPSTLDRRVVDAVAEAVEKAARNNI